MMRQKERGIAVKTKARMLAVCSMMCALGVVILLLGAVLDLGMYLCPILVGLLTVPLGKKYGLKKQLSVWLITSLLSILFVPNPEENLMYLCLFGWYPAVYPVFSRLPKVLRLAVKLLLFNGIIIAVEALVVSVLVPETLSGTMIVILLVLGNLTFLVYDYAIPLLTALFEKHIARLL